MKKLRLLFLSAISLSFLTFSGYADEMNMGFVNFKLCVEKSKQGQFERNAFESLKKQLTESLQKTDVELEDLAKKLEDRDYMDGLSPTAEQELQQRFQVLSQELSRYQNQYYQLLNQANMRLVQSLHDQVRNASEVVRSAHALKFLINEDSAFATISSLDFTNEVIQEMDKRFELNNGQKPAGLDHAATR